MRMVPRLISVTLALAFLTTSITGLLPSAPKAEALSGSQFNAGRIMDDFVFNNKHTMSVQDIQNFLNAKVPVCDTYGSQMSTRWNGGAGRYYTRAEWGAANGESAPFTCLKDYYENTTTKANNVDGAAVSGGISAAQIIYNAGQRYNINPQVLIILLQKEQSLITDDWPWNRQFRSATGYGCPDTAPCDAQYYGFYNQVENAAWQFNRYATNPNNYNFRANRNNYVGYNPNGGCGGSNVYINTQASASLYIYTPYQPNAAALNNLYGTGDGCSAYGNRNFWRMFNDWFGSTYANDTNLPHPNGTLVTNGQYIFIIENGIRRHIATPAVFDSFGYQWSQVKPASSGDMNLPGGDRVNDIAPGTIFNIGDGRIYVSNYVDGVLKKQWISAASFRDLNYQWSQVRNLDAGGVLLPTAEGVYTGSKHPAGSLVVANDKIYLMDKTSLRHVLNPSVFLSYGYNWNSVHQATGDDLAVPVGTPLQMRQGTIAYSNGGIYVIDEDGQGPVKRPLGPWECYQDRLRYSTNDWIQTPEGWMPSRVGSTFTC